MSDGWTPRLQAKAYDLVIDAAVRARAAGRVFAALDSSDRDKALHALADTVEHRTPEILAANEADLASATLDHGALERLRVTERGLARLADILRRFAEEADPLEHPVTVEDRPYESAPSGVRLTRSRVPLGVLGVVYEARPVTALEILGPALRAGNAVLLRGTLASSNSDQTLVSVIREGLDAAGLPLDIVSLLPSGERSSIRYLVGAVGLVDLVIVRGGPRLIGSAPADAKVPTLRLSSGNCHIYVDAAADPRVAIDVVLSSKADSSAPHAVEAVLVHADIAPTFVPLLVDAATGSGLRLSGDENVCRLVPTIPGASSDGWVLGHRGPELAVGVVASMSGALELTERYGQGHTEVIVSRDDAAAETFVAGVDSAMVAVNVPTSVVEGAPMFATQKTHARGTVTAADLTTTRWLAGRSSS